MSTSDLAVTQSDAYAIRIPDIQPLLQQLWREASDEGEVAVMHVRTLNLLVFVPAAQASSELMRLIADVSVQHPGRTITLIVTDDTQPPRANVAIACRKGQGSRFICGEHITLLSGDDGAPLPSIAASLLVSGLPTFLWWHGDPPFSAPLFETLVENADRIIVDSRTWQTPLATLRELAQAAARTSHASFTDLQWTALMPWRQQIAQCFDLPSTLPQLRQLQRVAIEYGPDEQDHLAALLLAGWVGGRLGWRIAGSQRDRLTAQTSTHTVRLELQSRQGPGGVHTVTLHSEDARFSVERIVQSDCVRTKVELGTHHPIEHIVHPKTKSLAELVGDELMVLEHDESYVQALHVAAEIVEPFESKAPGLPHAQ